MRRKQQHTETHLGQPLDLSHEQEVLISKALPTIVLWTNEYKRKLHLRLENEADPEKVLGLHRQLKAVNEFMNTLESNFNA